MSKYHSLENALEVGRRLGLCTLISAQPLIGSTIREFSITSVVKVVEVLCCLYGHRLTVSIKSITARCDGRLLE